MYNIYIIILIIILIIYILNNNSANNSTNNSNTANSDSVGNQYNSPIENQINNNIIYITNDNINENKYGNSPYSKFLLYPDFKFKHGKINKNSFGRSNSFSRSH